MSQFELFMGDGWPQMMYETMFAAGDFAIGDFFQTEKIPFYIYFMPIYFIFSHMMFNLVINPYCTYRRKKRTPNYCLVIYGILNFFLFFLHCQILSLVTLTYDFGFIFLKKKKNFVSTCLDN